MNTFSNVAFLTVATGLVSLGANTIGSDLIAGAVEIVLGIAIFIVYEKFPVSVPADKKDDISSSTS